MTRLVEAGSTNSVSGSVLVTPTSLISLRSTTFYGPVAVLAKDGLPSNWGVRQDIAQIGPFLLIF